MTKAETKLIKQVLTKIKNPDGNVIKAIAFCDKQLALYQSQKGQISSQYEINEMDYPW